MKKTLVVALTAFVALTGCSQPEPAADRAANSAPVETAAPIQQAPEAPVQLSGTVNNKGVKDYSGAGTNIAVEFSLDDFSFSPTFIKALPGSSVSFALNNRGAAEHSFTIDAGPLQVDQVVAAGASYEGQLKLPESGVVEFFCRFHVNSGMKGAFYFGDGQAVPAGGASPTTDGGTATGTPTGTGSPSGTRTASATRTASGPAHKTATAARTTTAAGAAPASGAQNRPGDLVIPDLNIGEPQKGASSLNSPAPKPLPTPTRTLAPKPQTNSSPNSVKGTPAKDGSAGAVGTPGKDAAPNTEPKAPDGTDSISNPHS